tara:strand:+ start:1474 stop:2115 length:642 start_codon:yes stop_codon:yes gene_type:complete
MKSLLKLLIPQFFIKIILLFKDNKKFLNHKEFANNFYQGIKKPTNSLDLGSGLSPQNPFKALNVFGVDLMEYPNNPNIKKCDLGIEELPFDDSYFDVITAYDLIEHIPRVVYLNDRKKYPFIFLMNEIHRCLRTDGIFLSKTPSFPFQSAYQDPTHVNIITPKTFEFYFCSLNGKPYAKRYGFNGDFKLIKQGWDGQDLISLMKKNNSSNEIN